MMARHPEIADQAYEELRSVVGLDRLPCISDQTSLPFVEAVIQELHRYHPVIPLATHSNFVEDTYEGRRIPKDSCILANIWYA